MSNTIIHLSDLHIGKSRAEATRLQVIINWISERHPGAPVVITGDITESATKNQITKARSLLAELASTNPALIVPGNHDYSFKGIVSDPKAEVRWSNLLGEPLGFTSSADKWMLDFASGGTAHADGLGIQEFDDFVFFGVDSGDPTNKQHTARGYISDFLADQLRTWLTNHKGKTRVVFLHHHPFVRDMAGLSPLALHNHKGFCAAVRGNCEALLFGHRHQMDIWWCKTADVAPFVFAADKSTRLIARKYLAINVLRTSGSGPNLRFSHFLEHFPKDYGLP